MQLKLIFFAIGAIEKRLALLSRHSHCKIFRASPLITTLSYSLLLHFFYPRELHSLCCIHLLFKRKLFVVSLLRTGTCTVRHDRQTAADDRPLAVCSCVVDPHASMDIASLLFSVSLFIVIEHQFKSKTMSLGIAKIRLVSRYALATARNNTSCNRSNNFSTASSLTRRRRQSTAPAFSKNRHRQASKVSQPLPAEEFEEPIVVSNEIRAKNAVMGASLLAFCFGVAWYSMSAVGQAGSAGSDDPLAGLRQEAAEAQERHDREEKSSGEATEMLRQFQAGQFDPDKYEEEEDVENKPKKRPWWKFW